MSHIGEAFCILSLLTKMDKLGWFWQNSQLKGFSADTT